MTSTVVADIRQLSDTELADVWRAGEIDLDQLTAESDRRDRAARARAKRDANKAAWWEAAHAQYQQASADCAGRLLSDLGAGDVASETELWTGADSWAMARASEELRNWWDAHGGRLSWARWQSDQRRQARAYRDERDLDKMRAPVPAPSPTRPAGGRAARPMPAPAPRPAGSIARYVGALDQLTARLARIDQLAARIAARPMPGRTRR